MSPAFTVSAPFASSFVASIGDPSRTRTVYATILLLVALGFTMILVTAWLVRRTRIDPPVLAPLEKMGDKYWRAVPDPAWQRRVLDEVRPPGAEPLTHAPLAPSTDDDFDLGPQPTSFDDISGDLTRPDDDDADAIGGFAAIGGFPSQQVAAKPSDADADADDRDESGGFPAPLAPPNPSDEPAAEEIRGFPSIGGFAGEQVAPEPSDDAAASDEDAGPDGIGGFPGEQVAPKTSDDANASDEEDDAREAGDERSLASGHGNAGPGRDDRPLP